MNQYLVEVLLHVPGSTPPSTITKSIRIEALHKGEAINRAFDIFYEGLEGWKEEYVKEHWGYNIWLLDPVD